MKGKINQGYVILVMLRCGVATFSVSIQVTTAAWCIDDGGWGLDEDFRFPSLLTASFSKP